MAPEPVQELPAWMLSDRKAQLALKASEHLIDCWKLEMAKIESDALGPQEPEEQQACVNGWIYLEKALNVYKQSVGFLEDSQSNLKTCIKDMECEMKSAAQDDQEKLLACIRQIKDFKKHQSDKLSAVHEQIDRIQSECNTVVTMLDQVAKDQGRSSKELMAEAMKDLGMEAPAEAAEEAGNTKKAEAGKEAEATGYAAAEPPQPEKEGQALPSSEKKKKKKGKK